MISIGIKNPYWYVDCAASSYLIYNISVFFSTNFDNHIEEIYTANSNIIHIQDIDIIALAISVNENNSFIHLHNVHYYPEININFLSFRALEAKGLIFLAKNSMLEVQNPVNNVIFQAKYQNNIYSILQSPFMQYNC